MMTIHVLAFGIAKDIFGNIGIELDVKDTATAGDLRALLEAQYPRLKEMTSFMIAVNNEYASGQEILRSGDEVAIIPPVSGG